MRQYAREIYLLIGDDVQKIPGILGIFFVVSILDFAGIAIIAPYIGLLLGQEELHGKYWQVLETFDLSLTPQELTLYLSIFILAVFFARAVMAIFSQYLITKFAQSRQVSLRTSLMASYQSLPYEEYLERNSAQYLHSIEGLTGQFTGLMLNLLKLVSDIMIAIAIFFLLVTINGHMFIVLAAASILLVAIYDNRFKGRLRAYGEKSNHAARRLIKRVHEAVDGFKEVRTHGIESFFLKDIELEAKQLAYYSTLHATISHAPRFLLEFIVVLFIVGLTVWSLLKGGDAKEMLPLIGVFGVAALRLLPVANQVSNTLAQLRFNRNGVSVLAKDLWRDSSFEARDTGTPASLGNTHLISLSLRNISFTYRGASKRALDGIDFDIRSGEVVGITGPSGAGKTTLIDILLGHLSPQGGLVLINGNGVDDSPALLKSLIAYIPQENFLIDDSVSRNIALGIDPDKVDATKMKKALEQSRLAKLMEDFQDGCDTVVGERGARLSGGQRQRVALARALYLNRDVIVLDESTNALDEDIEAEILKDLVNLRDQKAIILVSHKQSTLNHCHRLFRLKDGRVVQE